MKLEIVGPKQHIASLIDGDSNTVSTESFSPKTWGDVLEQPAATDTRRLSKIVNTSLISALVRPALKRREDLS